MKIGLFLPTAQNGTLVSTTTPQFQPTFDKLLDIVTRAEVYGIEFGLAMVKLHGFGGPSRYWDASLDPFTLTAGLLARTRKIKLFATAPVLAFPPALAARAAATIDSISPGRFGINIVTGWLRGEYESMGLWPGNEHFTRRYDYGAEYVAVLRDLWSTGVSNFEGRFFKMRDCRMEPMPNGPIDIVSAGTSDAGLKFAATHADFSFAMMMGLNDPSSIGKLLARTEAAKQAAGRDVGTFPSIQIVAGETDEEAWAKWAHYSKGIDKEAINYARTQASMDSKALASNAATAQVICESDDDIAMNVGRFIGSYGAVAAMLDEVASYPGVAGIMLALDDWYTGVDMFGTKIQPLMKSRRNV